MRINAPMACEATPPGRVAIGVCVHKHTTCFPPQKKVKRSKGQKAKRSKGRKVKRSKGRKVKRTFDRRENKTGEAVAASPVSIRFQLKNNLALSPIHGAIRDSTYRLPSGVRPMYPRVSSSETMSNPSWISSSFLQSVGVTVICRSP